MIIVSDGGGKLDRDWPLGLGSAVEVGVGPSFLGRGWPFSEWALALRVGVGLLG